MKRSIVATLAVLLGACSQSTSPQPGSVPATKSASAPESGPCKTGFVEIAVNSPACGIGLQADGSLSLDGRRTPPIIVSYQEGVDGRIALPAQQAILFPPSPQQGFRVVQGCEAADTNSLCWAVRLLDTSSATLKEIAAGKYGPTHWVSWSPAERHVALLSRNEGAEWLHLVDTTTGATATYPDAAENANWLIDRESFAWSGPDGFTVEIRRCAGCAPEQRRFILR